MAVQLHYYGSVFDLDPATSDSDWLETIDSEVAAARSNGAVSMRIDLADGRAAWLTLREDTPLAIVAPRNVAAIPQLR